MSKIRYRRSGSISYNMYHLKCYWGFFTTFYQSVISLNFCPHIHRYNFFWNKFLFNDHSKFAISSLGVLFWEKVNEWYSSICWGDKSIWYKIPPNYPKKTTQKQALVIRKWTPPPYLCRDVFHASRVLRWTMSILLAFPFHIPAICIHITACSLTSSFRMGTNFTLQERLITQCHSAKHFNFR